MREQFDLATEKRFEILRRWDAWPNASAASAARSRTDPHDQKFRPGVHPCRLAGHEGQGPLEACSARAQ
jgi:hypothetical protein